MKWQYSFPAVTVLAQLQSVTPSSVRKHVCAWTQHTGCMCVCTVSVCQWGHRQCDSAGTVTTGCWKLFLCVSLNCQQLLVTRAVDRLFSLFIINQMYPCRTFSPSGFFNAHRLTLNVISHSDEKSTVASSTSNDRLLSLFAYNLWTTMSICCCCCCCFKNAAILFRPWNIF